MSAPVPLIPPDLLRCQCEITTKTPWALGGTQRVRRCENKPTKLATETAPDAHGRCGSMSLCDECAETCAKQLGDAARIQPLWDF